MKEFIVVIYDKKSLTYEMFGNFINKAVIMRQFSDFLKNDKFPYKSHCEDYDLLIVGQFDKLSGSIDSMCEKVCCLAELKEV